MGLWIVSPCVITVLVVKAFLTSLGLTVISVATAWDKAFIASAASNNQSCEIRSACVYECERDSQR